ncbi:MAG TPA: hypothetical protein VMZ27_15965 [Candidatus Saccharimonadales bacterium]|nr:hypothetical protein [Candidatus Saccharimonadales bacterium]
MENAFSGFSARLIDWMRQAASLQVGNSAEAEFNALAVELFALQYQHNHAFQRICRSRKISSVKSWSEFPFIPSAAFKELELTSIPEGTRSAVFHSSGTTAQTPSRHYHCAESLRLYEAALLNWFARHFWGPADLRYLFLTPGKAAAPNSSLVHMFETIANANPGARAQFAGRVDKDGAWQLELDRSIGFLAEAQSAGTPAALFGTAFNFVHLLDELNRRGERLQLPAGSCIMETGGYKGRSRAIPKSDLHTWMRDTFGLEPDQILCEYGMSELSSQAYDRVIGKAPADRTGAPGVFHFPPWVKLQLMSPETGEKVEEGEIGIIRVFDLANVYSVAAIQTEDLGVHRGEGFELVGRATDSEARGCSLMSSEEHCQ